MATRAELAVIDIQHRRRQVGFGSTIAAFVLGQWFRLINPANIKGTAGPWLEVVIRRIVELYVESAIESIGYVEQVRSIQVPKAAPIVFDRPTPSIEAIRKSMIHVGPRNLAMSQIRIPKPPIETEVTPEVRDGNERLIARKVLEVNRKVADQVAASAVRHVRNGGRTAEDLAVAKDPVALGWVRVTLPGCCHFCAMLASRGPVYKDDSFAKSNADPRFQGKPGSGDYKVHDSCGCSLRPVYTQDREEWPEDALTFEDLWKSTGNALAFRQAYEGRAA